MGQRARPRITWVALAAAALAGVRAAHANEEARRFRLPGPRRVEVMRVEWRDAVRERAVPAKLYYPSDDPGPFPVVIFSHGLGGTREGYEYLGRHWASHGYVSVHLQHPGSDDAVWRGQPDPMRSMRKAIRDVRNSVNRPLDVSFALDKLEEMNRTEGPLAARLDMARVGVAGHSYGAYTALAVAGQVFGGPGGRRFSFGDPRVKAVIAMSAPAPRRHVPYEEAFGGIRVPCMHMTGTRDTSPVVPETTPEDRQIPFRYSRGADGYLVIFTDGDHMIFAGRRGRIGDGSRDARFHELIRMTTTAFWEAYLREDDRALRWLADGRLRAALGEDATAEIALRDTAPAEERAREP